MRQNEKKAMSKKPDTHLYSDPNLPVPPLRYDISLIPIINEGEELILIHDPMQYAGSNIAFTADMAQFLSLFDGRNTLGQIYKRYFKKSDLSISDLTGFVTQLDGNRVLHSPYFRLFSEQAEQKFEESDFRMASCTGSCYPPDKEKLRLWLDTAFNGTTLNSSAPLKALYAPHIDYKVGMNTYVKAFKELRRVKPKRVVIIGTSHYAGYYGRFYDDRPFVLSFKEQITPLGSLKVGADTIEKINGLKPDEYGISLNDRAHRVEHSIELHTVMSQYIWGNDVEILPVLVGSLDEFMLYPQGNQGKQLRNMGSFIRSLDDGNTFFLISGDQAHFGKKFGDIKPARAMLKAVKSFDETYLERAAKGNAEDLTVLMNDHDDQYRICGYPPLMLYLQAFPDAKGEVIDYEFWDEYERESGVTFAAIGYR